MAESTPRFSVVIPTYQRRDVVTLSVAALARQEYDGGFEVVVVVDGSTDGTAGALRSLELPFRLTVLEQPNRGAAVARNRGAAVVRGELLLLLDDDMEAHPRLLAEHDRSHHAGADVVVGHLPLHPASPPTFLTQAVEHWTEKRKRRLSVPGAVLGLDDLLSGQCSLPTRLFHRLGGFDPDFTRNGAFGDEDLDFGARLLAQGCRIVFNPHAISWQRYVVQPGNYLRQYRQAGRADVVFSRKHPHSAAALFATHRPDEFINRCLWRPLVAIPGVGRGVAALVRGTAIAFARAFPRSGRLGRAFFKVVDLQYWLGVEEGGGVPRARPVLVLAYHAIADLRGAGILEPYGVPPSMFRRQLGLLERLGFTLISPDEFLRYLNGNAGLPRRPVLLTFDDCHESLLHAALPALQERGARALAFAVSGQIGGSNVWDQARGAPRLRLLDGAGLRVLAEGGVEIGSHSRNHPQLPRLPELALSDEIGGSADDLEGTGLPRPRMFAYPHGEHDPRVRMAVADARMVAAFTIESGRMKRGADPFQIPRLEILRRDRGVRFLWKLFVPS